MSGGVHPRRCVRSSHERELSDLPTRRDFGAVLLEEVQSFETRVRTGRGPRNNDPRSHTGNIAGLPYGIPPPIFLVQRFHPPGAFIRVLVSTPIAAEPLHHQASRLTCLLSSLIISGSALRLPLSRHHRPLQYQSCRLDSCTTSILPASHGIQAARPNRFCSHDSSIQIPSNHASATS